MANLFNGGIKLKNGVLGYEADYTISASYSGTFYTLLNGATGLDGTITFKVKSTNNNWYKDVNFIIEFGGSNTSMSQKVSISEQNINYSTSFKIAPGNNYGNVTIKIQNINSKDTLTLAQYGDTRINNINSNVAKSYYTGGLCGIKSTSTSLTTSIVDKETKTFSQLSELGTNNIQLNYYWDSIIFKAEMKHGEGSGYEKRTPTYKIGFYNYKIDGTKPYYANYIEHNWTINNKNNIYIETIEYSIPLFLTESETYLDYPIREYFLYYNGKIGNSFYVTPFSFNLQDTVIAKELSGSNNYKVEVNLGNLNKWIDLNYSSLNLTFKAQNKIGEVVKINNILVGKITTLTESAPNSLIYEIYKDNTLITSKQINTIFGLDFSVNILSYIKKNYNYNNFSALQRGEEMNLSVGVTENSGSLVNEEVKFTLIVKNIDGQEKEIHSIKDKWEANETKEINFNNINIDKLIEINSKKTNRFYLKIISGNVEKIIDLGKEVYAYDYIKSIVLDDKIEYSLISGQDRVKGLCDIKEGSTLGITFPQEQFKDGLKIKLILGSYYYIFNSSSFEKEIEYNVLKELLNDSSGHIKIIPTQKNTKEISYEIQYSYDNEYQSVSVAEKLIITIPPLLTPTIAYRSKQVGINCIPSEDGVLDIKSENNFTKVNFYNKEKELTGYIDLEEGTLKLSNGQDTYLKSTDAQNTYLTISDAQNIYLKSADAENIYLKSADAQNNYQKKIKTYISESINFSIGSYKETSGSITFSSESSNNSFLLGDIEIVNNGSGFATGNINISKNGQEIKINYALGNLRTATATGHFYIKLVEIF